MKKASRWIIVVVILAVLTGAGYYWYKKKNASQGGEVKYVTETVKKGNLISKVSGTGQISASNQVDVKPKVSGDLVVLNIKNGQQVKEGELMAQVDSRDAARQISDARNSLEIARLDLDELLAPIDAYTLMQNENTLTDARESLDKLKIDQKSEYQNVLNTKQSAEDSLEESYEDAYNEVADSFFDFPTIITGLETILYSQEISDSEVSVSSAANKDALLNAFLSTDSDEKLAFKVYLDKALSDYNLADVAYDKNFNAYMKTSRYSDKQVIEDLLDESVDTARKLSDAIKSITNASDVWVSYRNEMDLRVFTKVAQYQTNLNSYTSTANGHLTTLIAGQRSVEDYKQDIADAQWDLEEMDLSHPLEITAAERGIKEKEEKLKDLKSGASEIDIRNKKVSIQQKENSLAEAQTNHANYFIKAPFDGVVAAVDASRGDSVSSGTLIATLVTNQKMAEMTLNEIDVAKITAGQKATLAFDAVEDLSITGQVAEVDTLGTVSQGVVSYGVKIAFDIQDERIKPSMSVSVSVITESKQNVLTVPLGAVKTLDNQSYAERLIDGQPQRQSVTIGSSNDTMVEVTSGLEEGDEVVTQTLNNGASTQTSSSSSDSQRNPGAMGGMMGMMR